MSDLRLFHPEAKPENTGKIVAGIVIVLGIAAAGVYTYEAGMWKTPIVSDSDLPSPGPVLNVPAKAPPPDH